MRGQLPRVADAGAHQQRGRAVCAGGEQHGFGCQTDASVGGAHLGDATLGEPERLNLDARQDLEIRRVAQRIEKRKRAIEPLTVANVEVEPSRAPDAEPRLVGDLKTEGVVRRLGERTAERP